MYIIRYGTSRNGLPTYSMAHYKDYQEAIDKAMKIVEYVADWTLEDDKGYVEIMEWINYRFLTRWAMVNIKGRL